MTQQHFVAETVADLSEAAAALLPIIQQQKVVAFYGDLGAGKTTLIKVFCTLVGVDEEMSSPTFALVHEYQGSTGPVFHFDFYRIKDEIEALDMGYEDYFYSGNLCLVEWPEKISGLLPEDLIKVEIESQAGKRHITISV